jgi:hypothetical protein
MDAILLDTSVIFDHLNGRDGRTAYLSWAMFSLVAQ